MKKSQAIAQIKIILQRATTLQSVTAIGDKMRPRWLVEDEDIYKWLRQMEAAGEVRCLGLGERNGERVWLFEIVREAAGMTQEVTCKKF